MMSPAPIPDEKKSCKLSSLEDDMLVYEELEFARETRRLNKEAKVSRAKQREQRLKGR